MTQRTLYDVLGVAPAATVEEIKAAWRSSMKRVHPDHGGSAQATMEVQAAYEVLSDAGRRAEYDRRLIALPGGDQLSQKVADAVARAVATAFKEFADEFARLIADAYAASLGGEPEEEGAHPDEWFVHLHSATPLLCTATTRDGWPCCGLRYDGGQYCWSHTVHGPSRNTNSTAVALCRASTKSGRRCRALALANGYCVHHGGKSVGGTASARAVSGSSPRVVAPVSAKTGPDGPGTPAAHAADGRKAPETGCLSSLGCLLVLAVLAAGAFMAGAWLLGWIKGSDHNTFQDREAVVSVCVNSLQAPLDEADLSSDSPTDAQIALISSARTALAASEPLCKKAADLPGHGGENIRKRLKSIVASSGALVDCVVDGLFFESFDCEDEAQSYADRYEDLSLALADRSDLWDLLSEGASDR